MVAVGVWAASQRGRLRWQLPALFVGTMAVGAICGAVGAALPLVEEMIFTSAILFPALIFARKAMGARWSLGIVAFFAFFHGFAHGQEMPSTMSLWTYGVGFLLATALLHAAGVCSARLAFVAVALFTGAGANAHGQTASTNSPASDPESPTRLPDVIVHGREDSLVGVATSASQGTVGAAQLQLRPISRAGEILEAVPGVIITQHAGGGKANQYFLRGFNLDHGTDFATDVDGMPLNLRSHGHGQGYTDMNSVIPEFVQRVNYEKGVYYAGNGDFASAGAAHLETFKVLPQNFATVEGGMFGYGRAAAGITSKAGPGSLTYGGEAYHYDGPWRNADDFQKFNGIVTYSQGDDYLGYSLTARGYHGKWDSSDQVAASAIDTGLISFFDSLDETTGGDSQRYSLQAEWHRKNDASATKVNLYGFYYDLDLFSNFTYFLTDPVRGDQFEQVDKRVTTGLNASHTIYNELGSREIEDTFGLQVRNDSIENGLYNTQGRVRVDKFDTTGALLPATVRSDDILETSLGLYYENKIVWTTWVRTIAGVRGDVFNFDVSANDPVNSGNRTDAIASPKGTIVFGPWAQTEFYVQGGLGFHSNDARGVNAGVDPADPLVQTIGAEVGVRTTALPGLHSSVSAWWLDIDSELIFVGDAGNTEASRPSRRYGLEFANYYNFNKWLTVDADFSISHAEFRDNDPIVGNHIPGSIETVLAAGITAHDPNGLFGGIRLRYFGPRPLIEDNSFRSGETILVGLQAGWHFNKTWTLTAEVFNVLDRRDHDIDYAYESQITPAAGAMTEIHYHPVEPIQGRVALTARF